MTDKAKRWGLVLLGVTAIYFVLFLGSFDAETIGRVIGLIFGALFGGGIVALILQLFWKKHTIYELWFASASIWASLFVVAKILEV
ncbi:MAG: hypothetical protein ISR48_03780 [Alphaproteobacteria bacterium]|nr:hypothetical protein [Alphaproteobacteria bacterium]